MVKLFSWLSAFSFIGFPVLIISSIWFSNLKLTFIGFVLLFSAALFSSLVELSRRRDSGEL